MKRENIVIQYALSSEGEYRIPNIGKVDGFCKNTNTVYEFHGIFWHGHPDHYAADDINPISGKRFGDLYAKTLAKEQKIRDAGYNLIVKWEDK